MNTITESSAILAESVKMELLHSLQTFNARDLYDALADNGLETEAVHENGSDLQWLAAHICKLVLASDKARRDAIRSAKRKARAYVKASHGK